MKRVNYRAFSMEYGTFIGLSWSVLFLSYVYGISQNNALLMMLCFFSFGFSCVLPFILAMRMKKILLIDDMGLSYMQGLFFSFSMFMYACLFNALIVYGYFEFFDNGGLFATLSTLLDDPLLKTTYTNIGMGEQYAELMGMMDELAGLSSFDKAVLMFNNNFVWSLILSFPVALAASRRRRK